MVYTLVDGKVCTPEGCEINVVQHCNLSCRACSHLSPVLKAKAIETSTLLHDLSILAKYYRPQFIKILGGEPLLHPQLPDLIDAVRNSGICNYILVCTNGLLLSRMSASFWERVDEVEISLYPGKELHAEQLAQISQKARMYQVRLHICYYGHFRESYAEQGTNDTKLIERIYETCQVAHVWRCQTVFNGYFFKCPQSLFIPQVIGGLEDSLYTNGLEIVDSADFHERLLAYLTDSQPLPSCSHCLGSAGKRFVHQQQMRRNWRIQQHYTTEDLLDSQRLLALEKDPLEDDSCIYKEQMEVFQDEKTADI